MTSSSSSWNLVARSHDVAGEGNFFQGCSFSPDGLCVLTATAADGRLRLYNTVFSSDDDTTSGDGDGDGDGGGDEWESALKIAAGDVVRSYAWYPHMSSQDPSTCCFAAASREQPVHLYDAYTGTVRATYRPFNGLDEMESPAVVHFTPDGRRLLCGGLRTDRVVHVFDAALPGRESAAVLRLGKTRRSTDGQKGLVSALATTQDDARYIAVGTYAPGSIYVYDDRTGQYPTGQIAVLNGLCVVGHGRSHSRKKRRFAHVEGDGEDNDDDDDVEQYIHRAKTKWFQTRAQGGVTQLKFAPHQRYILYSASRRSDAILQWDLRMLGDDKTKPVRGMGSFRTCSDTNQRLEFDTSDDGRTLFVGGTDRCVRIYDTQSGQLRNTMENLDDATNGVSFTRLSNQNNYLAVATGSRRFAEDDDDDDDDEGRKGTTTQTEVPGYLRLYKLADKEANTTTTQVEASS